MEAAEVTELQKQVAELRQKIDSFEREHERFVHQIAEYEKVHVSRRGVEGPRGERGEPGIGIQGPPGKDADLREAIYLAGEEMHAVLGEVTSNITNFINEEIVWELRKAGFIDANLKAVPGPKGDPGISNIPGPTGADGRDGADGKSIVGPAGRDAKIQIGSVVIGETASVSLREEDGVQILDFVLPRGERGEIGPAGRNGENSQIPGQIGPEGPRGFPGAGMSKEDVVKIILDMKQRGSLGTV
jgi:hypothetical protein